MSKPREQALKYFSSSKNLHEKYLQGIYFLMLAVCGPATLSSRVSTHDFACGYSTAKSMMICAQPTLKLLSRPKKRLERLVVGRYKTCYRRHYAPTVFRGVK